MADFTLERELRLGFLQIDTQTTETLQTFKPVLQSHLEPLLDNLFRHMRRYPALASKLGTETQIGHLKQAQTHYWLGLCNGVYDSCYFEQLIQLGKSHHKLGLEPRWYLGSYGYMLNALMPIVVQRYRWQPKKMVEVLQALTKGVFLDMDVVVSVYENIAKETATEVLNQHATDLERSVLSLSTVVSEASQNIRKSAMDLVEDTEVGHNLCAEVAQTSEKASQNTQLIATSTDQLASTITEISNQVSTAASITTEAVSTTHQMSGIVARLNESVHDIGAVTQLINDIANRTNLLALNASIEAARAGEAGKGFEVVASEVKNLAKQAADATEHINLQISSVQKATDEVVSAIEAITATIGKINDISGTIAAAVEEQSVTTQEISEHIRQAASGTMEVSVAVHEVAENTAKTGVTSSQVLSSAGDLSHQAEDMRRELGRFLQQIGYQRKG
jgi:methyl-accepting chemotaxis protein